ncbi:MAG: SpoIIE family protein phosphatase [Planctomycetaceae bacterium]
MPVLKVIKGGVPGQLIALEGERVIFGRHPNCQVVLDHSSISRHHAQIIENHGSYYLEDLRSRNGTQLNNIGVRGRIELHESDEIQLCDYVFQFLLRSPGEGRRDSRSDADGLAKLSNSSARVSLVGQDDSSPLITLPSSPSDDSLQGSSIISALDTSSLRSVRFNVRPEVKLRAVLEISAAVGRMLKVDDLLPVILQSLFKIFPQADAGIVMLKNYDSDKLAMRASLSRNSDEDEQVPVSMTIVRMAMEQKQAMLSADAVGDTRFQASDSLANLAIRSVMCVPLLDQSNAALGVIQISTGNLAQQFSPDDLDLLASVSAQASLAVENAKLHESLLQQRDLERELEFATQVQLGFLPNEPPRVTDYEFADYYEPAHRIGGDYFDYITLPSGNIAVALGDVAGKGVPAALLMARLHASARYHLLSATNPADAMTSLNAELAHSGLGFRFITLIMAVFDLNSHCMHLANAGHLSPLIRHVDGSVTAVGTKESGMPLGLGGSQVFRELVIPLEPGEMCVFYTDGVTEAMDAQKEIYGSARLTRAVAGGAKSAKDLVQAVVDDVEKFYGDLPQRDDLCIVTARRR